MFEQLDAELPQQFRPASPDDNLYVRFYKRSVKDESEESQKAGRPIFKAVDYVEIRIPGDKDHIVDQPVWDDPSHMKSHTARFPRQWAAYKAGQTQEIQSGTPLRVLTALADPILTPEQVEEFKYFKIHTAEQLLAMSDGVAQKFVGIHELKRKVQGFIDAAAARAPAEQLRSELSKRDSELQVLRNALKEQAEQIARLEKVKK